MMPAVANAAGAVFLSVVALLSLAASLCAARRADRPPNECAFWLIVAVLLALASLVRWTDADHQLTDRLRNLATRENWYHGRRGFQVLVSCTAILAVVAAGVAGLRVRGDWAMRVAAIALVSYAMLSLGRLVSLHAVDSLLYSSLGPMHVNWIAEIGLVGTIGRCAWATVQRRDSPNRPSRELRRPRLLR